MDIESTPNIYISTYSNKSMRAAEVLPGGYNSFEIIFKGNEILYSYLNYLATMLKKHGEEYAAFVNAFSTTNLKQISENRFKNASTGIYYEQDTKTYIEDYREQEKLGMKTSFFSEGRYVFKKVQVTPLTEIDNKIAGFSTLKVGKTGGSNPDITLKKRLTLFENLTKQKQ